MRLIHLLTVLSILTAVLVVPCPSLASSANFTLSPQTVSSKAGEKFDLNLSVNSGATKLDALEIGLKFDPQKLELTSFAPSNIFNAEVRKVIDNKTGSLLWTTTDITKPRKIISGQVNLGTLTFLAKESGSSAISFSKAQVGSIDSAGIISGKNAVSVTTTGSQNILQQLLSFLASLFHR